MLMLTKKRLLLTRLEVPFMKKMNSSEKVLIMMTLMEIRMVKETLEITTTCKQENFKKIIMPTN